MMYEMWRIKPELTPFLTQGIFYLQDHTDMVWEELAFDEAILYTQQGNGLQDS